MSDQIAIELGLPPWGPSDDAELVETLNFYEVPLVGILRQGGMVHLFACLEGEIEPVSIWAYSRVEDDDLRALKAASDLREGVMEILGRGPSVVALVRDNAVQATELVPRSAGRTELVQAAVSANRSLAEELGELLET